MKFGFTVDAKDLLRAVKSVKRVVPRKGTFPVLDTIRLFRREGARTELWLVATDLDRALCEPLSAGITGDWPDCGLLLPHKKLLGAAESLTGLIAVEIDWQLEYAEPSDNPMRAPRTIAAKGQIILIDQWTKLRFDVKSDVDYPVTERRFQTASDAIAGEDGRRVVVTAISWPAVTMQIAHDLNDFTSREPYRKGIHSVYFESQSDGGLAWATDGTKLFAVPCQIDGLQHTLAIPQDQLITVPAKEVGNQAVVVDTMLTKTKQWDTKENRMVDCLPFDQPVGDHCYLAIQLASGGWLSVRRNVDYELPDAGPESQIDRPRWRMVVPDIADERRLRVTFIGQSDDVLAEVERLYKIGRRMRGSSQEIVGVCFSATIDGTAGLSALGGPDHTEQLAAVSQCSLRIDSPLPDGWVTDGRYMTVFDPQVLLPVLRLFGDVPLLLRSFGYRTCSLITSDERPGVVGLAMPRKYGNAADADTRPTAVEQSVAVADVDGGDNGAALDEEKVDAGTTAGD